MARGKESIDMGRQSTTVHYNTLTIVVDFFCYTVASRGTGAVPS